MLTVQRTLPMVQESYGVSTNLPEGATTEDFYNEINKISLAFDKRMGEIQKKFLEMQKKEQMVKQVAKDIGNGVKPKTND